MAMSARPSTCTASMRSGLNEYRVVPGRCRGEPGGRARGVYATRRTSRVRPKRTGRDGSDRDLLRSAAGCCRPAHEVYRLPGCAAEHAGRGRVTEHHKAACCRRSPALPQKTFKISGNHTYPSSIMPAAHSRRFRDGKTLAGELSAAMHRIGALGITYPEGYCDELIAMYEKDGVPYPHILSILGEPRIRGHFFYARMPRRTGPFLDYGCGTGQTSGGLPPRWVPPGADHRFRSHVGEHQSRVRPVPRRGRIRDLFVVNDTFPFGDESFDTIYSGSVIHVIADEDELCGYLDNAWSGTRPGGILFGSTLGIDDGDTCAPDDQAPPRCYPGESDPSSDGCRFSSPVSSSSPTRRTMQETTSACLSFAQENS